MNSASRFVLVAAVVLGVCLSGTEASALDDSSKPAGANHKATNATGAGVSIGVIEGGPALQGGHHLGTRLKGQWDFVGKKPGEAPVDGSGGAASNHLTRVSDIIAADDATHPGVATKSHIYTANRDSSNIGAANHTDGDGDKAGFDATFNSYRAAVDFMNTPRDASTNPDWQRHPRISIINNSWGAFFESNDNGDNRFARFVDHYSTTRDVLFVGAAGNAGHVAAQGLINWPWDAFNGITVGALDQIGGAYHTRADFSEYRLSGDDGTQPDVRGKPDIVAPGVAIDDGVVGASNGTSFATPHVTGAAALVAQTAGFTFDSSTNIGDHLAVKAIVLNSARKIGIAGPNKENGAANDNAGTKGEKSDANYLNAAGTMLRVGSTAAAGAADRSEKWTPSSWSYDGTKFETILPLDDELGTGALDVARSVFQTRGGKHGPGNVPGVGWDLDRWVLDLDLDDPILDLMPEARYKLNRPVRKGQFITATLTWDRVVLENNGGGSAVLGEVDETDTYDILDMANMDLEILFKGAAIARSISTVDNVEHLHIPVPSAGLVGDYEIRLLLSGLDIPPDPDTLNLSLLSYGLAWMVVPEPASWAIMVLAGSFLFGLVRGRHPYRLPVE